MPYYFSKENEGKQPYIYYKDQISEVPFDIEVLLPDVFKDKQSKKIVQGAFELDVNPSKNLPYKVSLSKNDSSFWNFDMDSRSLVKVDFIKFLIKLENTGLKPGAMSFIRQSLAQFMPLTFSETLYYHYGLDGTRGCVDLQQGMRLKIDFQGYQLADPMAEVSQAYVNGYVGSGSVYYDLISYLDDELYPVIGFDAFLQRLLPHTSVDANQGGAGGMVDLLNACYARRYYRLLYPTSMVSSDDKGFVGSERNVTLIGTNTLEDLEKATDLYQRPEMDSPETSVCAFFRGRTVIIPEVMMYLRGRPIYVPLGTTVRQLMNRHTCIPLKDAHIPNLKYNRWMLRIDDTPDGKMETLFPRYERINFSGGNYRAYLDGSDCFDIPLLKGDAFTFPIPDIRS